MLTYINLSQKTYINGYHPADQYEKKLQTCRDLPGCFLFWQI